MTKREIILIETLKQAKYALGFFVNSAGDSIDDPGWKEAADTHTIIEEVLRKYSN